MLESSAHQSGTCLCCGDLLRRHFDRRSFIQIAGSAGLVAAFPVMAFAAYGDYEAMLLSCIDPRTQEPVRSYMEKQGLLNKYSQFSIAGAAIGVVAPKFKAWQPAFWDNLGSSVQLHNIKKVIVLDHRDCGAAKIAYGEAKVANAQIETETHKAVLAEFRKQAKQRQPKLAVETGLMTLDGKVEMFG